MSLAPDAGDLNPGSERPLQLASPTRTHLGSSLDLGRDRMSGEYRVGMVRGRWKLAFLAFLAFQVLWIVVLLLDRSILLNLAS